MSRAPIRVVIVDDSALIRALLAELLPAEGDIEVVGLAGDAQAARALIRECNPDVITLDIEMPGMDGLTFLERLMRFKPTPVVMISALTERGSEATLKALSLGAVDFVTKPTESVRARLNEYAAWIRDKVRAAALARVGQRRPTGDETVHVPLRVRGRKLLLIGASTGGTEAILSVLRHFTPDCAPVMIVQHMPAGFTRTFAARLDRECAIRVCEAEHGMPLARGHAYLAPGDRHLRYAVRDQPCCVLDDGPPVNRHRPAVDALFHSIPPAVARHAAAALLTGMGADGADGLVALRQAGALTIAQDEASCVVFGMPREAIRRGGAEHVLPIERIGAALMEACTS
jgi:two-component system chemotaxis response regulator CheB